jgi:hypothetical protein
VGPLGGKWRPPVEKVGEWYMKSQHLQGCSSCLSQLMSDGLAPTSKYWMYRSHTGVYGSSKPSSLLSTDIWFCPHCFIGWLRRETGYGPIDQSASVLWIVSGALFLGSSDPAQLCWWLREMLLHMEHVRYVWSWTIRGLSMGSVWRIGRVFPYRVYIDSNRRDSRIWVTACLWQSSRWWLNGMVYGLNLELWYLL